MITLKTEIIDNKFIRHYAEDEQGNKYYIRQVETGIEYDEAVDVIPCRYTYIVTDKQVENEYFTDKEVQGDAEMLNEEDMVENDRCCEDDII